MSFHEGSLILDSFSSMQGKYISGSQADLLPSAFTSDTHLLPTYQEVPTNGQIKHPFEC